MIQKLDKVVGIEQMWHGLAEVVDAINFDNSGLNWNVEARELFIPCNGTVCPVDGYKALVRADKDYTLHIAKNSYGVIQNRRIYDAIIESLAGVKYKIVSSGSIQNGRKVFFSVALDDNQDYVVNSDKFKNYVSFLSSHDGQLSFETYDCSIRLQCNNTINISRTQKGKINLHVYHTKNNEFKIREMESTLESLFEKRQEFYTSLEYLMSKPMTLDRANQIVAGFVANGDELSTRAENQTDEIVGLFQHGKGNSGQTYFDLLNGVTEYYTFHASDNKQKLFVSNEIGSAGEKKVEFYDLLMNDDELNQLAARGDALLKARQQAVVVA
jgi:phage/plasmid-like protein (TIGR03299 family)